MSNRVNSFLITGVVYAVTLVVATAVAYQFIDAHQWIVVLTGHLFATLVVFVASQIYKNSSLYDPFWSVISIPITIYVALRPEYADYMKSTRHLIIWQTN